VVVAELLVVENLVVLVVVLEEMLQGLAAMEMRVDIHHQREIKAVMVGHIQVVELVVVVLEKMENRLLVLQQPEVMVVMVQHLLSQVRL
jgi:hypothetical protein